MASMPKAGGKDGLPLKQPLLVGTSQAAMHEQIRGRKLIRRPPVSDGLVNFYSQDGWGFS